MYTKAQVTTKINANSPDNSSGYTTNTRLRELAEYLNNRESLATETKYTNSNKPSYTLLSQFMDYLMGNNIPIWANDQIYPAGYVVMHTGKLYRAKVNVSASGDEPIVNTDWDPVLPLYSVPTYDAGTDYAMGFVVQYDGKMYIANADVGGGEDPPDELVYWDKIGIFDDDDINELATIQSLVAKADDTIVAMASGTEIDWSAGAYFEKATTGCTFTYANLVKGKTITVEITYTSGSAVNWPSGTKTTGTIEVGVNVCKAYCVSASPVRVIIDIKKYV